VTLAAVLLMTSGGQALAQPAPQPRPTPAPSTAAAPGYRQSAPAVQRLSGDTRIETAIAISGDLFPGQAQAVVLARSDAFPDALAGGPLASVKGAPLLLTIRDQVTPLVEQELRRVLPEGRTVYLLGGVAALSEGVEAQVRSLGYVTARLSGPTRYDTSLAIARETTTEPGFIVVATGNDFPDALIGGSLAAPFLGGVLVLTDGEQMPGPVGAYLDANNSADTTTVGPAAAVAFPEAYRIPGRTPEERSVEAAKAFYRNFAPAGVVLASVERFPDGLAGAPHAFAVGPLPLLLTPAAALPAGHAEYVRSLDAAGASFIYGGTAAVGQGVADALGRALEE
jgi:hypothetical protein